MFHVRIASTALPNVILKGIAVLPIRTPPGKDMPNLRHAAIAALIVSTLSAVVYTASRLAQTPGPRFIASVGIASVVMVLCAVVCVRAVQKSHAKQTSVILRAQAELTTAVKHAQAQLDDRLAAENRALHRSLVVITEEYGDRRSVDAVLALERRRAMMQRADQTTVDLTAAKAGLAPVTPLRRQQS
jgi:hypothetical protein